MFQFIKLCKTFPNAVFGFFIFHRSLTDVMHVYVQILWWINSCYLQYHSACGVVHLMTHRAGSFISPAEAHTRYTVRGKSQVAIQMQVDGGKRGR